MTRAGKEPAEDVKRAIHRAIELAGLEVRDVRMLKSSELNVRTVLGSASPPGWPHELPAVGLCAVVGFDGTIGEIEIRCAATDGNPLMEALATPHVQRCNCRLEELPTALKEVWIARREVIARFQAGEVAPIFDGKWSWEVPSAPSLPDTSSDSPPSCDADGNCPF